MKGITKVLTDINEMPKHSEEHLISYLGVLTEDGGGKAADGTTAVTDLKELPEEVEEHCKKDSVALHGGLTLMEIVENAALKKKRGQANLARFELEYGRSKNSL